MIRAFRFALPLVLVSLVCVASALADSTSEYGEVERFGGFDSSAYNSGHYGGPLTPGEFVDPTGFAVDPEEGNAVYVADRTSSYKHEPTTSWRIQKLSSTGEVLGTTTFTLPNGTFNASALVSLAVDHKAGRLYALVIGSTPSSSVDYPDTVAQELLAWSITPNTSKELVAAPGLEPEPGVAKGGLGTTGGVVSDQSQLESGSTPLYYPQGIAIDHLETPGVDNPVVIEASNIDHNARVSEVPGDTIVQQVATQTYEGKAVGDLLASWSGASVAEQLDGSWGPRGISDNPDGTISVVLEASNLSATNGYVVRLNPTLSEATVLNNDAIEPPIADMDEAPLWFDPTPPFLSPSGTLISYIHGAGPEIAQLSTPASDGTGGLYAADVFFTSPLDQQFSPEVGGPEYWVIGSEGDSYVANIGVRLLRPGQGGVISSPNGSTIVNTLGNGTAEGPCNIGAEQAALAVGANGTLWVFDKGPLSGAPGFTGQGVGAGREIIELAPGAGRLCPQPSGTFTMEPAGGTSQTAESPLEIPAGTKVTFNASSVDLQHGKPFAYEWDLDGDPHNGANGEGFETINQMQPPFYYFPTATVAYTYTQPGTYKVRLRVLSDYGAYTRSAEVIVAGRVATGPQALFTVTSPAGSQQVTVDAAGSTPGGGTIAYYIWNWGDGDIEEEGPQSPLASHLYSSPGDYQVTLTVVNGSYQSATSAPQTVTVQAGQAPPESPLTGPLYEIPLPPPSDTTSSMPALGPTDVAPHARYSKGVIDVRLSCPRASGACAGTVQAQTAAAFAADVARRSGGGRRGAKLQRLQLGRAPFSLAGGGQRTVAIRISVQGMALLRKLKRLPALVIVAAHDSAGDDPGTATLRLTLTAASAHGRRSSRTHR